MVEQVKKLDYEDKKVDKTTKFCTLLGFKFKCDQANFKDKIDKKNEVKIFNDNKYPYEVRAMY